MSDEDFRIDITTIPVVHPVVDAIFLTEAGEMSIAKVSILSGSSVLVIFLACLAFCCCCKCYRECACMTCSKSVTAVYTIFTSESCRLKHANRKLRRSNRQKRKVLEKNLKEHALVDKALAALGVTVADTFDQNMEEGNVDHLRHQGTEKASSSTVDKITIMKEGNTSI